MSKNSKLTVQSLNVFLSFDFSKQQLTFLNLIEIIPFVSRGKLKLKKGSFIVLLEIQIYYLIVITLEVTHQGTEEISTCAYRTRIHSLSVRAHQPSCV